MRSALTAAAAMMLVAAGPPAPEYRPCPGFEQRGLNRVEADEFYVRRAINIVSVALTDDPAALDALIAPDARFMLVRGDHYSPSQGPHGAIEMVRDLMPTRFQSQSQFTGPISVIPLECTWDVTVLFRTEEPTRAVSVKFEFRDGLLVSAVGIEVILVEGSVR